MNKIIFLLAFLPLTTFAQVSISYSIDTVGGKDSFFLVEIVSRAIPESTRPQATTTSILFRDTSELTAYISRLSVEKASLTTRIDQMNAQLALLGSRITAISDLRDSVLPLLGVQNRQAGRPNSAERTEVVAQIINASPPAVPKKSKATKPKKPRIVKN